MKTYTRTFVLNAAQVNALDSTDVNLIPGIDGYLLVPTFFACTKLSGTAVGSVTTQPIALCYTGGSTRLVGLDAAGSATNSNALLSTGNASSSYVTAVGTPVARTTSGTASTGKGIDITGQGATIGSFDGTLQVTVSFVIYAIG